MSIKFKFKIKQNNLLDIISKIKSDQLSIKKYSMWCTELLIQYPPKYNANKFIYGGVSEYFLSKLLTNIKIRNELLGDDNYFDDIIIEDEKYSIKTKKNNDDTILINFKHNKQSKNDIYLFIYIK